MNAPNRLDAAHRWVVTNPKGERLTISLHEVISDTAWEFGVDPGRCEAHLQALLAASQAAIENGLR